MADRSECGPHANRASHGVAVGTRARRLERRFPKFRGRRLSVVVNNLGDRRYVGSVIVNDSNGRYFEPGPGRTWMLGARLVF